MNHPFTIRIKLRQHSPIIHFQHDQWGACLRATELKPKLDKFIIDKHFNSDFSRFKDYLVGFNRKEYEKLSPEKKKRYEEDIHNALDYKIKIYSPNAKGEFIKHKLFFGNMGKKKEEKRIKSLCVRPDQDIILTVFSFKKVLLIAVSENLNHFFAVTNFGTRQNKGFGSFYISERDDSYFKHISAVLPGGTYYMEVDSLDDGRIFSTIDYYYKRLKSGINLSKKGYHKSYLYQYLDANYSYTWEKRWIKEKFFGLPPDGKTKKFARALLGLPGNYFFKATKGPCKLEDNCNIILEKKNISRIKSPITFKVIKDFDKNTTKIYILVDSELTKKIDSKCKEKTDFTFRLRNRKENIKLPDENIVVEELIKCYHEELDFKIDDVFETVPIKAEIKETEK